MNDKDSIKHRQHWPVGGQTSKTALIIKSSDDIGGPSLTKRCKIESAQEFLDFVVSYNGNFEPGELIRLPKWIPLFHQSVEYSKGLFCRQEYQELFDHFCNEQLIGSNSQRRFIVIGSPGIGKSMFGIYCLMRKLKSGANIVYRPLKARSQTFFTLKSDKSGYETSGRPLIDKYDIALLDGAEENCDFELTAQCSLTILFSSPSKNNFNEINCSFSCLNTWSKSELEEFVQKANIDDDDWYPKFSLLGGVPRYLFGQDDVESLREMVEWSIPSDMEKLKNLICNVGNFNDEAMGPGRPPHLLIHFCSLEPGRKWFICYASPVIEVLIQNRFSIIRIKEIRDLLSTTDADLQTWRGRRIERWMAEELSKSSATMRPLEGDSPQFTYSHNLYPVNIIRSVDDINSSESESLYQLLIQSNTHSLSGFTTSLTQNFPNTSI